MKTPIVFIIFNRPDVTKRTFQEIKKIKPEILFVIADGPRNDNEKKLCLEARKIIDDEVDWTCTVHKDYSEKNLGCRTRISTGLNFVFENVNEAIILEDDCLPHPSFFHYCEDLLNRYRDSYNIKHISGNFFQQRNSGFESKNSYYYSNIPHIWGWATWARAWKEYDPDLKNWPNDKNIDLFKPIFNNDAVYEYWRTVWDDYYSRKIDSWDGQWTYACLKEGGLCINPTINLVSNIGFGASAIHTKDTSSIFANIPAGEIKFPLIHPKKFEVNHDADAFTWKQNFGIDRTFRQRFLGKIRRTYPKSYNLMKKLFKR